MTAKEYYQAHKKEIRAYKKAYNQRPEVKAYKKAYNQRPEVKAYYQKPEVRAKQKAYQQRPEVKARNKERHWEKEVEQVPHFSKGVKRALILDGPVLERKMIRRGIIERVTEK